MSGEAKTPALRTAKKIDLCPEWASAACAPPEWQNAFAGGPIPSLFAVGGKLLLAEAARGNYFKFVTS
jgi:hypothetical protein